jgi:hypothetical protein
VFERNDDTIVMGATGREAGFLRQIPSLLASVVDEHGDPGYAVLHRPLCLDDDAVDTELWSLASEDMDAQRAADRGVLERCTTARYAMTLDEAHGLLRSLNDARLVLAARAGAFEDGPGWERRIDDDPALAAVAWLGYVQEELLAALTART